MIISICVDDMHIFKTYEYCVNDTKRFISSVFEMKDLGVVEVILGIKIIKDDNGIVISQSSYIEKVLKKFDMFESNPTPTLVNPNLRLMNNIENRVSQYRYSQIINFLMYAMYCTRPSISFAVEILSSYMSNLGSMHWNALYTIPRYLK